MSTNAYMEQTNYPAHYGALPDRSAQVFATDSHEPRAPRPFEATHTASNDPYGTAAVAAHPQPGAMAESHSPMSSYRGSFSHPSNMGLPHHRQDSISSISSPHDVTGGWAPSSPGLTASRHASIYSLNGQFDQVGLGSSIDSGSTASHFYDQSPPLHTQVRYAQGQAADARRFSLDERAIRTQPQLGKSGLASADYQVPGSSGRHWPWGANSSSSIHGRHASVSAAPPQGYDHNRMAYGANSGMQPGYSYDANAMSGMSPRYRSMSSSAASGRAYGNGYGAPGTAAHAVAAMGYGMAPHLGPGMMLEGDLSGPGPARRAKFKRSRTGCLVCRKRKVKCSQDGTPCKQCRIGKRDCHYDDSPQKKKSGKKERSTGSIDASSSEKGSNGIVPTLAQMGAEQQQQNGHMNSTDPYYATMGALDHRTDSSSGSAGGVTFSMPFSNQPTPVTAHSSTTDSTWSNPSPFAPGPHGETHPETHQVTAAHADGYGWPAKQDHVPAQATSYADPSVDRNAGYWSQHPTAYPPRASKLEVTES